MKYTRFKSLKSQKRTLRKRNPFYKSFSNFNSNTRSNNERKETNNTVQITAPRNFSIINNHQEMLAFFTLMNNALKANNNIYLNMNDIENITEDAILYLISRLIYVQKRYPEHRVSGNFPKNKECEKILFACKFNKYVVTNRTYDIDNNEILYLVDGFETDGKYVQKVLRFVSSKVNLEIVNRADAYSVITEVLINSKHHAYKTFNPYEKWWMIALPDKNKKIVHITLLDNGQGIPRTIKKNFADKVSAIKEKFSFSINGNISRIDSELIVSALEGEFRTSTGDKDRGTGMPTIFDASNNPQIDNLIIISNFAYVKIGKSKTISKKITLNDMFEGTLISWDFIDDPYQLERIN
ncbi:MAG: hypothetical protein ACM3O3_12035 [Syntrophothermus sp.]